MINILEHVKAVGMSPARFLNQLANDHWSALVNETPGRPGHYGNGSIIKQCLKYAGKAKSGDAKYLAKYADNNVALAQRQLQFFDYLAARNFSVLKRIVTGRPLLLQQFRQDITNKFGKALFYDAVDGATAFGKLLSDTILDYPTFRSGALCADLMWTMGFKHARCPYCGYKLVEVIKLDPLSTVKQKKKALLDVDHFYSKSEHPYLAVSFFNLIPSCETCNQDFKSNHVFELHSHVHPHHESFHDHFEFELVPALAPGGQPTVAVAAKKGTTKIFDDTHLGLATRYENGKDCLLGIERKYRKLHAGVKDGDYQYLVESMLETIPRNRKDFLRVEYGKAMYDILKAVDFLQLFPPA